MVKAKDKQEFKKEWEDYVRGLNLLGQSIEPKSKDAQELFLELNTIISRGKVLVGKIANRLEL